MALKPLTWLLPVPEAGAQPPPGDCLLPEETALCSRPPPFQRMLPPVSGSLRGPLSPIHGPSLSSLWGSGRLSPQPHSSQSPLHQEAGSDFTSGSPTPLLPSHVAVIMRREGKSRTNTRYIKQGHSYWDAKETTWNQLKPRWLEIVWSLTQNHSPLCLNSSKMNHKRSKSGQWPNSWKIPTIP